MKPDKKYFSFIRVMRSEISLFVDEQENKLHVLDLDNDGTKTVTNSISKTYLTALSALIQTGLDKAVTDYMIIIYPTDGLIYEWDQEIGIFFLKKKKGLYSEFLKIAKLRESILVESGFKKQTEI